MRARLMIALALLLAAPAAPVPSAAAGPGDLAIEMTARKVVRLADGTERTEPADRAKPGETIEYVAVYRNKGKGRVADLLGTIPVPAGMAFIPGTARPESFLASLDGKAFAPAPLRRRVRLPDGKEALQDVPAAEYRALRWKLPPPPPGGSVEARARMRILTGTP